MDNNNPITLYVVVAVENDIRNDMRVEGPYTLSLAQERLQHLALLPSAGGIRRVCIAQLQHFQDDKVPFTFVKD